MSNEHITPNVKDSDGNQIAGEGRVIEGYRQKLTTINPATGLVNLDLRGSNDFALTLTGNVTLNPINIPGSSRVDVTLYLTQDGTGGHTITFPGGTIFDGGTIPTLSTGAGEIDVVQLVTLDGGTTWFGFAAGIGMA